MLSSCREYSYALLLTVLVHTNLHTLVGSSYILRVEVHSYASSTHVRDTGLCCRISLCTDCNNNFKFCLTNVEDVIGTCQDSTEQYTTQTIATDMEEFDIGTDLDIGVPNPLVFTGERWPGSVNMYARVNDVDPSDVQDEGLVAEFEVPITLNPDINNSTDTAAYPGLRNLGQFLRLAFQLSCEENFYGEDCAQFCIGRDDEEGHYSCDINGGKICLDGFQDPSTNCTQCVLAAECSPTNAYCNSLDSCVCRDGYTGPSCLSLSDYCGVISPCQNGASCTNVESGDGTTDYLCTCLDGFQGRNCSDKGSCFSSPCLNSGTCLEEETAGYRCLCPSGFHGKDCELKQTPLFMGPFIGAVVAIGILLIIIVILACILGYTFWQISHPPHRKQPPNADSITRTTTFSQTDNILPTSANTYEFDDGEEGGVPEIALASLEGASAGDLRKNSETFDNPIYDQPTPPTRQRSSDPFNDPMPNSLPSLLSISISSAHDYPPHAHSSFRLAEAGASRGDPAPSQPHKYEDVTLCGSEECLNASFKASNSPLLGGSNNSMQLLARSDTEAVDKLTVINETYDPLPCHLHSASSSGYHGSHSAGSSGVGNGVDTRRVLYKTIVPEVISPEVFGKDRVPNHHDIRKYPEGFHGNSLRLDEQ